MARYVTGELSGFQLKLIFDCIAKEPMRNVTWLDTDQRKYAAHERNEDYELVEVVHEAHIILVSGGVAYVNPQPAKPFPDVRRWVRGEVKSWRK